MTFNPTIPRPGDLLNKSQGDLLTNNSNLNAIFSRNHIPLNIATNFGKHSFIEMVNSNPVGSPPTPALSTGVGVAYTKSVSTYSATTESEIFYTPDTTGKQYQITRTINGQFSLFGTNTNYPNALNVNQFGGWTFLPGGLLLQYGQSNIIAGNSGSTTVPFPILFNQAGNAGPFSLTIGCETSESGQPTGNNYFITSLNNSQFVVRSSSSGARTFFWMAIGI
jgi:hypothetical protein